MKRIPYVLIYSRVVFAFLIVLLSVLQPNHYRELIVWFMVVGLLTDVFDGIIARQLNVSEEKLRVLDSNVDQIFWIATIACILTLNFQFVKSHFLWMAVVIGLELMTYVISYSKFKKPVATHTIFAKFWLLTLMAFLIDLNLHSESQFWFWMCIVAGILSRLEIALILIRLKNWITDVPSIFQVTAINKGEPISRNKLFNG